VAGIRSATFALTSRESIDHTVLLHSKGLCELQRLCLRRVETVQFDDRSYQNRLRAALRWQRVASSQTARGLRRSSFDPVRHQRQGAAALRPARLPEHVRGERAARQILSGAIPARVFWGR